MHRMTPLASAFVGFTSGGARALVDAVTDNPMMQEMKGSFMKGESRKDIEAPQNYGFSSVVMPATKGKDGQIQEAAEAIMSFVGGNRSFPMCAMMDDRRFRPMGLKPGENAQYDDQGQMTLLRRTGLFLLSLDTEEKDKDGKTKKTERMVSLRHVEKKKQERPKLGQQQPKAQGKSGPSGRSAEDETLSAEQQAAQQQTQQKKEDFKHEGETVNTEIRCTKSRIEFRAGDTVVGYYDTGSKRWVFIGEIKLGTEDADHPVYGLNKETLLGQTTEPSGNKAVLVKAPKPGPPTSLDAQP